MKFELSDVSDTELLADHLESRSASLPLVSASLDMSESIEERTLKENKDSDDPGISFGISSSSIVLSKER